MNTIAMMRVLIASLAILIATPAVAQLDCGNPEPDKFRKLTEAFSTNVAVPLIKKNAGDLGPFLWMYIAGQARAESITNMRDSAGNYHDKPGFNLWNIQAATCTEPGAKLGPTVVHCKDNKSPTATTKSEYDQHKGQYVCWNDESAVAWQIVYVCKLKYPGLDVAAEKYLEFNSPYTEALTKLAKKTPPPTIDEFMDALVASQWSDRAKDPKTRPDYIAETKDAVRDTLRGLAQGRETAEKNLAKLHKDIDSWCSESDNDNAAERAELQQREKYLLERIAFFDTLCLRSKSSAAPTAHKNLDECRNKNDPGDPALKSTADDSGKVPTSTSRGAGDPHYVTPAGTLFSTQDAGEFWFLKSQRGTQIQVRQTPWQSSQSVAIISAVAIAVGKHRIGVYADGGAVYIDGNILQLNSEFTEQKIGDDHVLGVWSEAGQLAVVAIMWADGSTLRIVLRGNWIDLDYQLMPGVDRRGDAGLIGRPDNHHENNFIDARGRKLSNPDKTRLHDFVNSWRTHADESLFDYWQGKSHGDYDRRDFPTQSVTPDANTLGEARSICADAGVNSTILDACAFDVAVTGQRDFVQSHALLSAVPASTTPPLKLSTPPLEIFSALFKPDINNAIPVVNGQAHTTQIAANEQQTFLINITNENVEKLFINSQQMTCIQDPYDGITPGFQLFNSEGLAISKAVAMCSDLKPLKIRSGRYYLVVGGATSGAPVTVNFESFYY